MSDRFRAFVAELMRRCNGSRGLERRSRTPSNTLNGWVNGTSPTVAKVERFAAALGLTTAQALGYEPLPFRFLERFSGEEIPNLQQAEIAQILYEIEILEEKRRFLNAALTAAAAAPGDQKIS